MPKKKVLEAVLWGVLGGLTGVAITPGGPESITPGGTTAPATAPGSPSPSPCPEGTPETLGHALVVGLLAIAAYLRQNTKDGGSGSGSGSAGKSPAPGGPLAPA